MARVPKPPRRRRHTKTATPSHEELREQEVLRATRELAAYFRGRRTEREARGALKIIKAFIRDRERTDPSKRRPLPGTKEAETPARKGERAAPRKRLHVEAPAPAEPMSTE